MPNYKMFFSILIRLVNASDKNKEIKEKIVTKLKSHRDENNVSAETSEFVKDCYDNLIRSPSDNENKLYLKPIEIDIFSAVRNAVSEKERKKRKLQIKLLTELCNDIVLSEKVNDINFDPAFIHEIINKLTGSGDITELSDKIGGYTKGIIGEALYNKVLESMLTGITNAKNDPAQLTKVIKNIVNKYSGEIKKEIEQKDLERLKSSNALAKVISDISDKYEPPK